MFSGNSPIQVRFIGWLVIVCAGGFGGWIWWAASMSTKLDVVINNQAAQLTAIRSVVDDVSRLKEWRIQVDTVGSPALVKKVDMLGEEVAVLTRKMELHLATTTDKANKP